MSNRSSNIGPSVFSLIKTLQDKPSPTLRYKPPTPSIEERASKVCQYKCNAVAVRSAQIPSRL